MDVLAQYNRFVKPAYDDFIRPTMKHADIIIPFSKKNDKAVEMLIQNLKIKMKIGEHRLSDYSRGLAVRDRSISDLIKTPESIEASHGSDPTAPITSSFPVAAGLLLPSQKV